MITVKGKADADWAIISHIIDPSAPNVEFKNVTFDCKTIKDASGHIFVRQKAGEWIEHKWAEEVGGLLISNYECSECHSWEQSASNYCPNCGARMRGEE